MSYHPLTRGKLRSKDQVMNQFQSFLEIKQYQEESFFATRKKHAVQPWRRTGLPLLINSRTVNLMTAMHFVNKSDQRTLMKVRKLKNSIKVLKVFEVAQRMGRLQLNYTGEESVSKEQPPVFEKVSGQKRQREYYDELEETREEIGLSKRVKAGLNQGARTRDEISRETPMWYILQQDGNLQKTVNRNCTQMFWLSYFLRKALQEENLEKVLYMNNGTLDRWQSEQVFRLYYQHQAAQIHSDQLLRQQKKHTSVQ